MGETLYGPIADGGALVSNLVYVSGGALNPDALYSEELGNCFLDSMQSLHELSFLSIAQEGADPTTPGSSTVRTLSSSPESTPMG